MRDLLILVPDKNTEYAVRGALSRPEALGIRQLDFELIVEPERDPGVRVRGVQLLAAQRSRFEHAVLLLDHEGSGSTDSAVALEGQLDLDLSSAWGSRAKAIVIDPEMDIWVWGAETHLRAVLEWSFPQTVREWLEDQHFAFSAEGKPDRPKEALAAACRHANLPRSSAQYEALTKRLSKAKCSDPAYKRLRSSLVQWFPTAA